MLNLPIYCIDFQLITYQSIGRKNILRNLKPKNMTLHYVVHVICGFKAKKFIVLSVDKIKL